VIVPVSDVLYEGTLRDKEVEEEHPPPGAVTVTVVAAMLMVDITVVVPQEVTVDARQCDSLVDSVSPWLLVAVPLVVVEVDGLDIEEDGPPEDVGELVADEVPCGTPHSSKLWPSSQHQTRPPISFQAQ